MRFTPVVPLFDAMMAWLGLDDFDALTSLEQWVEPGVAPGFSNKRRGFLDYCARAA